MEMQQDPHREDPKDHIGNVDDMVEFDTIDRILPVPLTDQERMQIGEDMAAAQEKGEQAERDKKAADDEYKGVIEAAYADVSGLSARLRRGKKDVAVQCTVCRDYRVGSVKVTRMDTMETIERRPMTSAERQMGLKLPTDDDKKGNGKGNGK